MPSIQSDVLPSGVRLLTFDRPDSAANIFDAATLMDLNEKLDAVEQGAAGVVFISAKPGIFIAGADLRAVEMLDGDGLRQFIELGQKVFSRIAALRIPSVAAIHGACLGGGYELCLACNWRIATADRATKIGLPETQLGILPAWGGCTRLPRLIGVPRALDIILGGKTLPAKAALRRGLIDDIAPRELLLPAALNWIRHRPHTPSRPHKGWPGLNRLTAAFAAPIARRRLQEKSRGHYPALPMALDAVTLGVSGTIDASLARERASVLALAATPECRNLIRLFHLQDRAKKLRIPGIANLPIGLPPQPAQPPNPPGTAEEEEGNSGGRRAGEPNLPIGTLPGTANLPIGLPSQPAKPLEIRHVAVIGSGVMGAAIAQWLSSRGLRVLMRDIDPERVAAGVSRIATLYADAVKRHILDRTEARDGMDRISPVAAETPLTSIDLVIEAAVEKMDLKKQIFARLDDLAPPRTLLATNTSALSITELAAAVKHPCRVVGIHFFNPVHRMTLVEVVTGEQTSPETAAAAVRFVQKIGKTPVLVRDSPGFLVNRILLPYMVEAVELFAQGAAIDEVDAAMLDFGMPMGPLRLIDEVGLDVAQDVAATLAAGFPLRMRVPAATARMLAAGLLGKKSGRGFYLHKKGKSVPNPDAAKYRESPGATTPPGRMAMQRRMVLLMVNEAARCIEEKVVAEPADVDFGMIMGTGFAPFRGGPLRYADTLGAATITEALKNEAAHSGAQSGAHFAPCQLLHEMAQTNRKFYADS